ncbi:MAG: hypothetical protein OIF32_07960 [Campylobacterales bacterium]|nr:hypothetical protein [Campylobacterales bacterium]
MHTITLNIDNSIYSKFMGLLDLLPKDKVTIEEDGNYPDELVLSKSDGRKKVSEAVNNISTGKGVSLDEAFEKAISN